MRHHSRRFVRSQLAATDPRDPTVSPPQKTERALAQPAVVVSSSLDGGRVHLGALASISASWALVSWSDGWVRLRPERPDALCARHVDSRGRLNLGRLEVTLLSPAPVFAFVVDTDMVILRSAMVVGQWLAREELQQ